MIASPPPGRSGTPSSVSSALADRQRCFSRETSGIVGRLPSRCSMPTWRARSVRNAFFARSKRPEPAASEHSALVRLGRSGGLSVLRDAVHRRRVAPSPAGPLTAAHRERSTAVYLGNRRRAGVRARARRGSPRHQAREHPARPRSRGGGGFRNRAGTGDSGERTNDGDRNVTRHAALHESRTGLR